MTGEKPDCQKCGACCWSRFDHETYCDVVDEDRARLGSWGKRNIIGGAIKTKVRTMRAGPLKGYDVLICAGLRGDILHRVSCAVYERRPRVCRIAVKPGSRNCMMQRRMLLEAAERGRR